MTYDFQRYDLSTEGSLESERSVAYLSDLSVSLGFSKEYSRSVFFASNSDCLSELNPCWNRVSFNTEAAFSAYLSLDSCLYRSSEYTSVLDISLDLIKRMSVASAQNNSLDSVSLLSKCYNRLLSVLSEMSNQSQLQFNVIKELMIAGSLNAFVEAISFTTKTMLLNLTIPAGGTLVIDTNNCTAYLNGVNVFSKVEGDWFRLSKDDLSFVLSSSGGAQLSGAVAYVERYL